MSDHLQAAAHLRQFYQSGITKPYAFRIQQLHRLKDALHLHAKAIEQALYDDLKKNPEEVWITETGFLIAEINFMIRNLKQWMKPQRVPTNLLNFPSGSYIYKEPLGVVLIIGPWNYPLQLLLAPLVGAIAAGNCAVLKPSELAPATATLIRKIISENFSPDYITVMEGAGEEVIPQLMSQFRFDHVFYTGSTPVGKKIYAMAAEKLTPVTLEMGGKSPCVIAADANLQVAAKRIAVTKFSNAGQMCVAPDYVLVHHAVKEEMVALLKKQIVRFYSDDAAADYHYGKIINKAQLDRLKNYLQTASVLHGGNFHDDKLYMAPTIVEVHTEDSPLLHEEIFGPILPVVPYHSFDEAIHFIQKHADPLAFYIFSESRQEQEKWLHALPFGGGCVNNASWHFTNYHLPFGGRGDSGMGRYHGKYSFDTFTHQKAVMKTATWFDPKIKYPPFKGKLNLFRRIIR